MTYHYGYNEGTLLQAYATQEVLKQTFPGSEVRIVDWRYPPKEELGFAGPRNGRERKLRDFFDTSLDLSEEKFETETPEKVFDYLSRNFDLVVVGSDELWRTDYRRHGYGPMKRRIQDSPWAPPFPNVYWPDASQLGVPVVALASSIGHSDRVDGIPRRHRLAMRACLQNMSAVCVRDSRTEAFCQEIAPGLETSWLPDPTFTLPESTDEEVSAARALIWPHRKHEDQKVVAVICHTTCPETKHAIKRCKERGDLLVSITKDHPDMDVQLGESSIGPELWSALTCAADLTITDRFHGAVFSFKSHTPVIAFDYRAQASGHESKLSDLFRRFEVSHRCFTVRNGQDVPLERIDAVLSDESWPKAAVAAQVSHFRKVWCDFAESTLTQMLVGAGAS